jgi:hypothetical protein
MAKEPVKIREVAMKEVAPENSSTQEKAFNVPPVVNTPPAKKPLAFLPLPETVKMGDIEVSLKNTLGKPDAFPWLPEAAKMAGIEVRLRDTGMNSFRTFFAYANGDIHYEHITDPEQRRMNDWLTVFTVMNTAWPYVPVLGAVGTYRYSRDLIGSMTDSNDLKTAGAIASVLMMAPLNLPIGLYHAANFVSTKIRLEEFDKAMVKVSEDVPKKLKEKLTPITEGSEDVKADPFVDTVTKVAATFLFAFQMPLLGTYNGISAIGDATHLNRLEQYVTTAVAAPILGAVAFPFLAIPQAYKEAGKVVDETGISKAATKFFDDLPDATTLLFDSEARTKFFDKLPKAAANLFDSEATTKFFDELPKATSNLLESKGVTKFFDDLPKAASDLFSSDTKTKILKVLPAKRLPVFFNQTLKPEPESEPQD